MKTVQESLSKDLTPKITFKKLSDINQSDVLELMNHPKLRTHMPLLKGTFDETQYHSFITAKEKIWEEKGFGPWALTLNGTFMGWGGLQPVEDNIEVALVLHPNYWGYGRVIYNKIIEEAFCKEGLKSVIILLPPTRTRIKAILSLGFKTDGEYIFSGERYLRYRLSAPHPSKYVIGICGISGSGKTAITRALSKQLNHAPMIFWDDFEDISEYPSNYIEWYKNSRDHSAWKTPALAETLEKLKLGQKVTCPATNKLLEPAPFIIYDAPLGRDHIETGKHIDFLIFLDTPPDIALIRRLKRDYLDHNHFDARLMKQELELYEHEARPLFLDVKHLEESADLTIDGTLPIQSIVEKILHLITQL